MAVDERTMAMDVARWMPQEYSTRLGTIATACKEAVETTIALHPLDDRDMLAEVDVLTDSSRDFALTAFGQEVLTACSIVSPK